MSDWYISTGGYALRTRTAGLFDESPEYLGGDVTGRCDCCALRISHTEARHDLEVAR